MDAPRDKSFCVLEYHTSNSVVTVQRAFRAKHARYPPTDKTIGAWYKQFTEIGFLCNQKTSGRPLTAEDDIEYHIDMCRFTPGAHIEHLWFKKTSSVFVWLLTIPLSQVLWFSCYKCL
jgi:hypothetical protein